MQLFFEELLSVYPRRHASGKWIDDIKPPVIKNNEYRIHRLSNTTLFKLPRKIQQKIIDKYYYNIDKTMRAHYPYFKKRYPNLGILLDSKKVNMPNYEEWSNEFVRNVTVASLRKYSYLKEYLNFDQWANDFIGDIVFVDLWQKNKYDFFYRESKILLKQSLLRFYTTASTVDTQLPPLKNPNLQKHLPAYYMNHKIISDPEIQWEVVKTFYWPREALSYVNMKKGVVILLFNSRRKYVERALKLSRYQDPIWIEIGKWTLSNNVTTDQAASITFFEHSLAYLHHKDFLGAFLARHAAIQLQIKKNQELILSNISKQRGTK